MRRVRALLILSVLLLLIAPVLAQASCDAALLVIDVQNWFLAWHPWITASGEEILPAIQALLEMARAGGVHIIYIRDLSLDLRGDNQTTLAIPEEIAARDGDAVFTKLSGDALSNPDLVEYLEETGITRLLISGIASDGCVQSTFRSAYRAGYEILIVTDAHAHSAGEARETQQMNRTWLGWGLEGEPMAAIDWASFSCLDDGQGLESSESIVETGS